MLMLTAHPALSLADATLNLAPDDALGFDSPWYVPLAAGRGDDPLQELRKLFENVHRTKQTIRAAFVCHRGAGKSTELKQFLHELRKKYEPLYLEADGVFDIQGFDMEELLLVLAHEIERKMREELKTPLQDETLSAIEDWFSKTIVTKTLTADYLASIKTQAKAKAGIPFFATLFAELTAMFKAESKHKTEVKSELKKYPGTLVDLTNRLLTEAAEKLLEGRRLLIVIDNMDRYQPVPIDHLLVKERDRLKALNASFIFTPPATLLYRPESQRLDDLYDVVHLPTVKLRERHRAPSDVGGTGYDLFREVLNRRMDLGRLIEENALRRLIAATGGAVRELILFARNATLIANGDKITLPDVEKVLLRAQQGLRDFIAASDFFPPLGELGAKGRITENPKCLDLLYHRLVYRYNGAVWYDVHPLIHEMEEYQTELRQRRPLADVGP